MQYPLPWSTAAKMYFRGMKPEDARSLYRAVRTVSRVRGFMAAARLARTAALIGGTGVVVADDATVIGVADDPLLVVSVFMVLNTLRKINNIRYGRD